MTPSSQDIVTEANKKIEDLILINVLRATGDDKARGQAWYEAVQQLREQLSIIRRVAPTAEKIPLMAVACDIDLASLERGKWPKWRAILTGDVSAQPKHPWLLVGTQDALQPASAPAKSSSVPQVAPQPSGSLASPEVAPAPSRGEPEVQDVEMEDAFARPAIPAVAVPSQRTKGTGKQKQRVQDDEEEEKMDEDEPVERGRQLERVSTSKDLKGGRSRAKSMAPSAPSDDALSRRTKGKGKQKEKVNEPEEAEEDQMYEEEPVERGRTQERANGNKDPKRGRSRAKSKAPSATADDASTPPKSSCDACARRNHPCTPLPGRACLECNSRKVRCSMLIKPSRSASRPRVAAPLTTPAPSDPTDAPKKKVTKQTKLTATQKPPPSKRGRSQSRPRPQTAEATPPPTRAQGSTGILLKITPASKRAREESPEETTRSRKAQKFDGVLIPKPAHTKQPIAPTALDELMKAYTDLKKENEAMRSRMQAMEDTLFTLSNNVDELRERDGPLPRPVRPTISRIRFPFERPNVQRSSANPVGPTNIPHPSPGFPPPALPLSTTPNNSPPPSVAPKDSQPHNAESLPQVRGSNQEGPSRVEEETVPQIAASLPESRVSTEKQATATGLSGADLAQIASVAVMETFGIPPPLFPLK